MSDRYYEVIITGRQMAALVAGVVILVLAAFGLGVAVQLLEPAPVGGAVAVTAVPPPASLPGPEPQVPTPSPAPAATALETAPVPMATAAEVVPPTAKPAPPTLAPASTEAPPPAPTARAETPEPAVPAVGSVWVQVAAVSRPDLADGVKQRVVAFGFKPDQLHVVTTPNGLFKVRLGAFPDLESAGRVVARLQEAGFEKPFIVKE
ncbi:MAG TPA: SPOR domain-containing protein [Thermoanaerobaculaceae bacterium]|nr:SPOR domain-containing protein [Thermoanaerobaculaceae bacterium]